MCEPTKEVEKDWLWKHVYYEQSLACLNGSLGIGVTPGQARRMTAWADKHIEDCPICVKDRHHGRRHERRHERAFGEWRRDE